MPHTARSPGESISVFVHDRLAITITLILVTAASAAWIASYNLMPLMMSDSSGVMAGMGVAAIVSSVSLPAIAFFEAVWIIGMAAMMFPAMIPMVIFYNRVKTSQESNVTLARVGGTPLFLAGYMACYALFGIGAYLAVYAGLTLSSAFPFLSAFSPVAAGTILVVAGIYQFSSLKNRCLSLCVSPFGFFATHSNKGLSGAFQMGFSHGVFCVGCCWAYMLVMLAVGAMSIPVMAVLTGVVALEKVVVRGSAWFNSSVALGFVSLGILVAVFPSALAVV